MALEKAFEALEHKDAAMRDAGQKVLREMGPNRPEIRVQIDKFAKALTTTDGKQRLREILQAGPAKKLGVKEVQADNRTEVDSPQGIPDSVNKLELRRQYVEARRAWIAGGKQGPPPEPPPGA
ncbi:hypothetical protein HZA57_02520 [Candidatus Poribacteria bacterium]|nr:hypothetical protein [Candidatus Poribacteria bacterium]